MSEEQPLLPNHTLSYAAGCHHTYSSLKARVSTFLESKLRHKIVLILLTIDVLCVLADVSESLLFPICSPHEERPQWLEVLSHISLAITSTFLFELCLELWCSGISFFNPFGSVVHSSFHLLDATVIIATFVLELVLKGSEQELASLLIILRFWRLLKVVEGITVGAAEMQEETAEALSETRAELEMTQRELLNARQEIQSLRQRLSSVPRNEWN